MTTSIDIILSGLRNSIKPSLDDGHEEKKIKEEMFKDWKETKCFHCGCYFLAKNWHTPPSCPNCHWSRVD